MNSNTPSNNIANPGSTLGEAIGALVERHVHLILKPLAEYYGHYYLSAGPVNIKRNRVTRLILADAAGNDYSIDAVVVNQKRQPVMILESKYIRYTKHNRDKGSWICTAHYSLRRTYPSIRKSLAILAGSWSRSSKALMQSFDIDLHEVPFRRIVSILSDHKIRYDWGEKDREMALVAWMAFNSLSPDDVDAMGRALIEDIIPDLEKSLEQTLSEAAPRMISGLEVVLHANLQETKMFRFQTRQDAIAFLDGLDEDTAFDEQGAPGLAPEQRLIFEE
ncbi:MAG: hypothetical protein IT210_20985 [Armatimonadetes bacterium]|nr:hypothetical protein [Armatimonadota bacterium]